MTRRTEQMEVPMGRAAAALPARIEVGDLTLEIESEGSTLRTEAGRGARYRARWARGSRSGPALVEIVQTSKMTSSLSVYVGRPQGLARLGWGGRRRRRMAEWFIRALRYHLETRAEERADGFEVRRTSPSLVRARSA